MSRPVKSECAACGEAFSSVGAFDFHRVGPYVPRGRRRCLTALEMLTEGMILDDQGCWGFAPGQARPDQATLAARYGQTTQQQETRSNL